MSLDTPTRERIEQMIAANDVLVFMKGNRSAPQCGFSATVCGLLDGLLSDYSTVDVLADSEVREGIKEFSSWPTIPQLYVRGEFVGGCDIIQELAGSDELAVALGIEPPELTRPPRITITPEAVRAVEGASSQMPEGTALHLTVDARFESKLFFGPPAADAIAVDSGGYTIYLDRFTAARADGVRLDAVDTPEGPGFRIDNPNAPNPGVQPMSVHDLKRMIDGGHAAELFDVRTPEERATASIPGARLMTPEEAERIAGLPKDTPLVFHCHHGGRSQAAAEHFAQLGFTQVFNVVGGIDAWSQEIDPSVPRY